MSSSDAAGSLSAPLGDGGDPRTAAVLRSRGVPRAMGTVRLGGSGRPFPVTSSGLQPWRRDANNRGTDSGMVHATAGSAYADPPRHLSIERHPSSPFGRKIERTQKLVLVPDTAESERFQVRKSIIKSLPHKRKLQSENAQSNSAELEQKLDRPANLDTLEKAIRPPSPPVSRSQNLDTVGIEALPRVEQSRPGARVSKVGKQARHQRPPTIDTSYDQSRSSPVAMQAVTTIPADLQIFTQRVEESVNTRLTSKAFHTAFHMQATRQSRQRDDKATANHVDMNSGGYSKTAWRQVDESIEHIYKDPSTDFVQLKLLVHKSGQGSKRQMVLERERVLAAASELRERQMKEQAYVEALQRKKSHVEKLSDAIRARNRKLVVAKSEPIYDIIERVAAAKLDNQTEVESKRKPPVPRQRGRRKAQLQTRNSQLKATTDAITAKLNQRTTPAPIGSISNVTVRVRSKPEGQPLQPGSVSSSILLGDSGEFVMRDVRQSIGEESQELSGQTNPPLDPLQGEMTPTVLPLELSSAAEQRPPPLQKRPRATRRTPQATRSKAHEEEEQIPVVSKEKSERRELAREFIELQKQSRHLRSVQEKQKLELDKQRRRLQLEKLEQERIESLRRSKKKSFKRSRVSAKTESSEHNSSRQPGFRRLCERDKNIKGFPVSGDDSDAGELREIGEDHDSEFFESDQENQHNSRNRPFERDFDGFGGHDASVLIGFSPADDKCSPVAAETPAKKLDVRLQRLLELEEKTLRLSRLVIGMKARRIPLPSATSAQYHVAKEEKASEDDLRFATPRQDEVLSDDGYGDRVAKSLQGSDDASSSVHEHDNRSGGDESEAESSFREENANFPSDEHCQSLLSQDVDHEEGNDETQLATEILYNTSLHPAEEVRLATSASIDIESAAAAQLSYCGESHEFDPRTIGVYNIKVEWLVGKQHSDDDEADDHASVSSRHSSASSSQASSRSEGHRNQLLSSSHASLGSEHSGDPFEVSCHSYMQQRQLINQEAEVRDKEFNHEASSSHSSLHIYRAELASVRNRERASEANEAFLRLVREADDSLSVINSTAKKIWLQQQHKLQAQADKKRQRELEELIEEQERKDHQLKVVMDSLTARHVLESDGESDHSRDSGHESPGSPHELPFCRLEDIMQQIEDDKSQEREAAFATATVLKSDLQPKPASLFWNDMLASSEPLARNMKTNTVIDRSELLKQQTQRQDETEDAVFLQSYQDELKRVYSPKTLSRLLLAEVEYNEAIHEAHLQLSIMEHAQVVEQAQEETMNVATAFKEEMESNFTNHQLALEHAVLSKQFDGDLHDVMQELEVIQQTQAQEIEATAASVQAELRLANLREVTVQTEELKRTDVATNAKLYAESGTTTSPLVCDAAVQYESQESPVVVDHQNSLVNQQLKQVQALLGGESANGDAYSEAEYKEENFERESQSVIIIDGIKEALKRQAATASPGSVNSEISEDEDELGESTVGSNQDSVAESVSEDDVEELAEKKPVLESSANPYEDDEIHSDAYEAEREAQSEDSGSVVYSAIEEASAVSDYEKNTSDTNKSQGHVASTSMGYEDDFDVSTSQVHDTKKSANVDSEIDGDDVESEAHSSGSTANDIEEDEVQSETGDFKQTSDIVKSEGSGYSSEFSSGTAKEEPSATPVATVRTVNVVEQTVLAHARSGSVEAMRFTEPHYTPLSLPAHNNDDVMPAYQRDLEQRRQSDESLLNLRLQVLERKFQNELQSLGVANADSVPGKHQELQLRREAAKMAFLSDKTNVESLRAASMARYYQDMLAFQSLMADVDSNFNVAVTVQRLQISSVNSVVEVSSDRNREMVQVETGVKLNEAEVNTVDSMKNKYDDEFDSVGESAELKADEEVRDGGIKSQRNIGEASEDDEASEIQDDDDHSSAKQSVDGSVESDRLDEDEGDAYENDFASVTNSGAVGSAQNDDVEAPIDDDLEREASVKSEATSDVGSVAEDEIDKSAIESKEKAEVEEYDDYEDEFTLASESEGAKPSSQAAVEDEDDEIADEAGGDDVDAPKSITSDDDTSQVQSEKFEDDFESDDEAQGAVAGIQKDGTQEDDDLLYSNDFDTEVARGQSALQESQSASKQLDVAETIVVTEQSGSEDSSTTKLLIEQVQQLQQQTEKLDSEAEAQHAKEKLARKKIKAIELVQAKERLIKLEMSKFKLEEEQRQVNVLAQLAIQIDVNNELGKAKDQIKQQLENEMVSVQQNFPAFDKVLEVGVAKRAASALQPAVETTRTAEGFASMPEPGVTKEKQGKTQSSTQAAAQGEDISEDEYEVDSFEEELTAVENAGNEDEDGYAEEYPSFAEEGESHVEEPKPIKETPPVADEDSEIASKAEDEFASVSDDGDGAGSEIRSEQSVQDANDASAASERDVKSEPASVDDYADEYEYESFDDANSVKSTHVEEAGGDAETQKDVASDEYDDEEYSEEDFEKASEASAVASTHFDENETRDVPSPPVTVIKPAQHSEFQEDQRQHVYIDELSTALEVITSQLQQPATEADSAEHHSVNLTAHDTSIADQSELPAHLSAFSMSHEEEVLSKSIEEQTKRLEELKCIILVRKDEILSVQKHMRVEKRKEQLTGQEKLLWDEMERVETNLRLDEAALELTRQRNRLEAMRLKVKHDEHKAKLPGSMARPDLLEGFDFVEFVEIPSSDQTPQDWRKFQDKVKSKSVWGATSDMICQTDSSLVARLAEDFDLLTGYVYIEEAERVFSDPTVSTATTVIETDQPVIADDALSEDGDEIDPLIGDEEPCAPMGGDFSFPDQDQDIAPTHEPDLHHPAQTEEYAVALLDGYSYVEAVEVLSSSGGDLLASFDFVEDADPVESQKLSEGGRKVDFSQAQANECSLELSTNDLDENDISCESGDDECSLPLDFTDREDKEEKPVEAEGSASLPEAQQYIADSRFDVQLGPPVTPDDEEVLVANHVADAVYDDLFIEIWRDSQELRHRRASNGLQQEQDAEESSREEMLRDAKEDDSIKSADDTDDLTIYEAASEAQETCGATTSDLEATETAPRANFSEALVDQFTDTLFDDFYDQVLDASTHTTSVKKKQHISHRAGTSVDEPIETKDGATTGEKTKAVAVMPTPAPEPIRGVSSATPLAARDFVSSLIRGLEIDTEGIQMPAFNNVVQPVGLKCARITFESVREVAANVLSRLRARENNFITDQHHAEIDIAALRQDVQVEMERILSIRDAGNDELKRFTQSLSVNGLSGDTDETSQDDLRLMQTQFHMNVSLMTDHVRRTLLLDGGASATALSSTPGSLPRSFYPRTPTPRVSTSSSHRRPAMLINTLLRHETAQLHQRITDLILDDLLNSTTGNTGE